MSSTSSMEIIQQQSAPVHRHPISRIIDRDIVSPNTQPLPLFDTTAWEESVSKIFAFDDLKGEFVNPFLSSPSSNASPTPSIEYLDLLREIDELIDEFTDWKSLLISSWKREQDAVSPKTRETQWVGIPKSDSPTLGPSSQVSLLPSHSSSLKVEPDPRQKSPSLGSLSSDGTSVYSQIQLSPSPSPTFPPLRLKLTLTLPVLRRKEKVLNLRSDYSSQKPTSFSTSSTTSSLEIRRNEMFSPITITSGYVFSTLLTSSLCPSHPHSHSTSFSPFPSFLTEMDIDSLLADHSSEAYTFVDHDDWKGEAGIFTLIPQPLLDKYLRFFIARGTF